MSDLQSRIDNQRQVAEQARRTAERAERERLEAEAAPRRAAELEAARLAALEAQAVSERIAEVVNTHRGLLNDQRQQFDAITTALEAGNRTAALAAKNRADALARQAESYRLNARQGGGWNAAEQQEYHRLVADPQMQERARERFIAVEVHVSQLIDARRAQQQLPDMPAPHDLRTHLVGWIAQLTPGSAERTWRAGLVYGITGELLDPGLVITVPGLQIGPSR